MSIVNFNSSSRAHTGVRPYKLTSKFSLGFAAFTARLRRLYERSES